MMEYKLEYIEELLDEYGTPLYVFDEDGFVENYHHLENAFKKIYPKYQIAYLFYYSGRGLDCQCWKWGNRGLDYRSLFATIKKRVIYKRE